MGAIESPRPTLLLIAASSRYDEALGWGAEQAAGCWGPTAAVSDAFAFTETDYYQASMGTDLKKQFWAFPTCFDPQQLPAVKRQTNQWEADYAALGRHREPRPLNLDPGYLTQAKLVLASTKDHAHRLYLADGIYAEVTLQYRRSGWQAMPWTYPDYQRADYHHFFTQCRELLRQQAN